MSLREKSMTTTSGHRTGITKSRSQAARVQTQTRCRHFRKQPCKTLPAHELSERRAEAFPACTLARRQHKGIQHTGGGVGAWRRASCSLPVRCSSSSEARQVVGRSITPQWTPSPGSATLVLPGTAVNSWQVNPLLKLAAPSRGARWRGGAVCFQAAPANC